MKLTINTILLQTMVAKAMKGSSNDKSLPITSFMVIELKNHTLTLTTTDYTNYLYIKQDKVEGDDFYVVVQAELFSKLISRLTCETVSIELKENCLEVNGNGKYSIDLPLDEEGRLIKYNNKLDAFDFVSNPSVVNLSTIKLILNTAKASLDAGPKAIVCYTGYYLGNKIVTTDTKKICGINIPMFDVPQLVSPELMNLLDVMEDEKIEVHIMDDTIVFVTDTCVVYGKTMINFIPEFQIDAINGLLAQTFESSCTVSKSSLLQMLDRLSLFVGEFDKDGIYLTFTNEGLMITSKKSNGSEVLPYIDSKDFSPFTCCINIQMLTQQVKSNDCDNIEIQYGKEIAIKLVDGNVSQIIALMEDDR